METKQASTDTPGVGVSTTHTDALHQYATLNAQGVHSVAQMPNVEMSAAMGDNPSVMGQTATPEGSQTVAQPEMQQAMYGTTMQQPGQVFQQSVAPQQNPYSLVHPQKSVPSLHSTVSQQAFAAGVFGLIVVGTGALGTNIHRVQDGEMSVKQAVSKSVVAGVKGGVTAAGATAAASWLTKGGALGIAVTVAVGTGISYLINK